jgi:hypothetical protein
MISDWIRQLNVMVKRCEERPDRPTGDLVYRVIDLFTTQSGSWEPSDRRGAAPGWARERYLRPLGAPDFFDDAGGDHHLFARVLDANGNPIVTDNLVRYWSDGFERLGDPGYHGYVRMTPKRASGWVNQPIFNSFSPERGESGAWCWCPEGAADVVCGGGLPNNEHVSIFAVWKAEPRTQETQPQRPTDTTRTPDQPGELDAVVAALLGRLGIVHDQRSAFAVYARAHSLGAPLTDEVDLGAFRVQAYANGIVYAPRNDVGQVRHRAW